MLRDDEEIDALNINGFNIIQHKSKFKFGMDAVLLANFVYTKRGDKIVDLGSGTGIIPILIAAKSKDTYIIGIEIQKDMADMANRSILINELNDRISILNKDIRNIEKIIGNEKYDIVTANPPYLSFRSGFLKKDLSENISRYELNGKLEDFVKTTWRLLKFGGKFFMVHRADRIVDVLCTLRNYDLEPKKIQFVQPNKDERPNIMLIECKKGAKPGLTFMKPMYIYKNDGEYTEELLEIYNKTSIEEV